MNDIAKILMGVGFILFLLGFFVYFFGKIPGMGRLPGDILIKKEHFTFYFPLATSIVISILLSLIFFLFSRR